MDSFVDRWIIQADHALRAVSGVAVAARPTPAAPAAADEMILDPGEKQHSAGLMRVNHVGEVCAQALYQAQALATRNPALRAQFEHAARDEADHLAWTATRLEELGSRPSLLNPFWYAGAFALGVIAGKAGDPVSLGFLVETEKQVEQHLAGHLEALPEADLRSRAIVEQMRQDEVVHGANAAAAGAVALPALVRGAMRGAARIMTTLAYRI